MTGVRMDTWLWPRDFFKTRPVAKRACELGRILSNGQPAKAAREVRIGDKLRVSNDGGDFQIESSASQRGARSCFGGADDLPRDCREPGTARESGS